MSAVVALHESPRTGVALIGTGLVGSALLARLDATQGVRLVGVANSRQALADADGIAPDAALARLADEGGRSEPERLVAALLAAPVDTRIVIDATPAEAIATRHADWLRRGVHVVSANKIAQGTSLARWQALRAAGRSGGARYGDAATVGAGLPALATVRRFAHCGDRLLRLEGVFSGSLSFLFNALDGTRPFSALLAEARARGYTEPDPRADLSGADVARKLLILARTAGFALEEDAVDVQGVVPAALRDLPVDTFLARLAELDASIEAQRAAAAAQGKVLRYLAELDAGGAARVGLRAVPTDHACAQLSGADNLFVFTTQRYRERPLVIRGPGAGAEVTAQALLADALAVSGLW